MKYPCSQVLPYERKTVIIARSLEPTYQFFLFPPSSLLCSHLPLLEFVCSSCSDNKEETRGTRIKVEGKELKSQPFYATGRMKPRNPSMMLSIACRQEVFSVRSRSCCVLRWFTYCFCRAWTADINAIATNFSFGDSSFFKSLPRDGYTCV